MIYWIKAGDTGLTKIGFSAGNVPARIKIHQTGCPWPLLLVRTAPGGRDLELSLHRLFRSKRFRAEWFKLTDAEIAIDLATVPLVARSAAKGHDPRPATPLARYKEEAGLSLSALAAQLGFPISTINGWVLGKRRPNPALLARISDATGNRISAADIRPDLAAAMRPDVFPVPVQ